MKQRIIQSIFIALFIFVAAITQQVRAINDGNRYAKKSVLSSGKWIQMKVAENAIYKLTYDDIRKQGIDPAKAKIYGYGGWILDENFTNPYTDDLPEVSVYINKGSDGIFNSGDYLLFYGRGTVKWTYKSATAVFEHENNPYATYGSYFLTESETGGLKEMTTLLSASNSSTVLNTFDDYALHEKDLVTIANTGRELFGESFVNKPVNQTFSFSIPGITSDPGKVRLSFAASPGVATPIYLSIDGQELVQSSLAVVTESYKRATLVDVWRNWNGTKTEQVPVIVSYNAANQSIAYLNCIALNMKRSLRFYNTAFTFFRNKESISTPVRYTIENANASGLVWDITNNYDSRLVQTSLAGNLLSFNTQADNILHEYVMVDITKSFLSPEFAEEVKNQDLHGLPQTEMIILTPPALKNQADILAEKHRTHSGLQVIVVDDRSVFNEFSSGTPDATAYRRFMKMFYDRATTNSEKPKYLLLFGDCLFDNRHFTADAAKMDPKFYLLSYQVKESVNENNSYGTDDYFGFLDDNEGINLASDVLDLGIGRYPVNSVAQASDAVKKVISYMDNTQYGKWKNKLIFTADDTDYFTSGSFCTHASQSNDIANFIDANYPEYILSKYYMDAYKSVKVNGKNTYPEAKKNFLSNLKEGCFLLNYTGHGSITGWSAEDMLNASDVRQMTYENLPIWITATCDFGWFDGLKTSGGEEAFLNKKSGAIALFTTSRVVNSWDNKLINEQLVKNIFRKENEKHLRLGDIIRRSKITLGSDDNKLNYCLLGDPALVLNYPEWNVQVETINGDAVQGNKKFTFKELDKVTVSGSVTDNNGNKIDNFSGTVEANIFDSKQTMSSLLTDNSGNRFQYTTYSNMIYKGKSEVKSGNFEISFTVPSDISYIENNGRMNFYASDITLKKDASGSFQNYFLAGTNEDIVRDEVGPEILEKFLNSENFKDGDNVNETPFFYARVADKDGINRSGSGWGHDIQIIIDGKPNLTSPPLNDYYESITETEGMVGYSIPVLPTGKHTLIFRIWDIFNNSSVDSLHFNVVKGLRPEIFDLQARENPAKTQTYFTLIHNLPETQLDVEIRVYDLTGRPVWIHTERGSSGYLKNYAVEWNLVDNAGRRVQPGIYIYRAAIRTSTSEETTKAKKIIVLKQ